MSWCHLVGESGRTISWAGLGWAGLVDWWKRREVRAGSQELEGTEEGGLGITLTLTLASFFCVFHYHKDRSPLAKCSLSSDRPSCVIINILIIVFSVVQKEEKNINSGDVSYKDDSEFVLLGQMYRKSSLQHEIELHWDLFFWHQLT